MSLKNLCLILIGLTSSQIYTMASVPKSGEALKVRGFTKVLSKKDALYVAVVSNDLRGVQNNIVDLPELSDKDLERFETATDKVRKSIADKDRKSILEPGSGSESISEPESIRLKIFNILKTEISGFYYRPLKGAVIDPDLRELFKIAHDGCEDSEELAIPEALVPVGTLELSLRSLRVAESPISSTDSPRHSTISILEFLARDESRAASAPVTTSTPPRVGRADGSPE